MKHEIYDSVWTAIAKDDAEARNLAMRSELMTAIEKSVGRWSVTQALAAKRLGITRPRLNDLLRGKLSKFSLDALAMLAMRAGLSVKIGIARIPTKRAA
jgi:predicted XRE-type DNA-binding protein